MAFVVGACSPKTGDFASEAAKYIEGKDVATWAKQAAFTGATCDQPTDTKVDTAFQCTATGSDGHTYVFNVIITADRQFRVDTVQPSS
jgi:hypothetical protein